MLAESGYDRLTMDAVANEAKASKATLYRRWSSKPEFVVDAVCSQKEHPPTPDTGSLRGDLLAAYCGMGGLGDARSMGVLAAVVTAMSRDEEFAQAYRRDFIGPKQRAMRVVLDPGIVLHRVFLLGEHSTPDLVARVIDQIILPAVSRS